MAETTTDSLLASLIDKNGSGGSEIWAAMAATEPKSVARPATTANQPPANDKDKDKKLDELLGRVKRIVTPEATATPAEGATDFTPLEPATLRESGVSEGLLEELVMKYLLASGTASGRE